MDEDKQRKLAKRLLATFQEELSEHVRGLNEGLLALEKDPQGPARGEQLKSLFRAAHSLKGAARAVGLRPVEAMCHHLEEVLRAVQDGLLPVEAELFADLYRAADALEDARGRIAAGRDLSPGPLEEIAPRLAAIGAKHPRSRPLGPPTPVAKAVQAAPPTLAAGGAPPAPAPAPGAEGFVRVPAAKLDVLLARSGELLVAERRLERGETGVAAVGETLARLHRKWRKARKEIRQAKTGGTRKGGEQALSAIEADLRAVRAGVDRLGAALADDRRAVGRVASLVDEEVRRTRLVPFAEACQALDRTVRDLAKEIGKDVEVVVEGASIEIDRSILEGLKDPLLCLARNAVDHGIEAPAERRRAGKPERGRVLVAATLRGSRVEVSVADDGAGVDVAAIRETARRRGLPEPRDDRECVRLLFEPGFSTAGRVTEISGRGVGLDIVKTRVEAMHGGIDFTFEAGRGTRVGLTLPVTLTRIRALLVSAGGETFAVAGASVVRLLRLEPAQIKAASGREVVSVGEGPPVPIVSLARVLGLPAREAPRGTGKILAVLLGAQALAAFAVEELLAEREILSKGLGGRLRSLRNIAGGTILETGKVALILSVADLIRAALEGPGETSLAAAGGPAPARKRILLADDSVTTRSLERAILEAAGYDVLTAVDGEEAWRLLRDRGADLVVSDVDMPRMDGFSLCKAIRGSKRFRDLPVVLVTALESEQDKARGGEAGADAYIVKSGFDQRDLLKTVSTLLGGGS